MEVEERKKRLPKGFWVLTVVFVLLGLLVLYGAFRLRKAPVFAAVVAGIGLVSLGLTAYGALSLVRGTRRKGPKIACLAVGGTILECFLAIMLLSGLLFPAENRHYDYRDNLSQISSMELVRVDQTGSYEDEMQYTLIRTIPQSDWTEVLERIAALDYSRPFNDPPTWFAGDEGFLIRFSPSVDGVTLVLIQPVCPVYGERSGSRVRLDYRGDRCREMDDWNTLLRDFGGEK